MASFPASDAAQAVIDAWRAAAPSGQVPTWSTLIATQAVADRLAQVSLIEIRTPMRLHLRVAAPAIGTALGMDLTGQDQLAVTLPGHRGLRYQRNRRTALHPCGLVFRSSGAAADAGLLGVEGVLLPVREDDQVWPLLLCLEDIVRHPTRARAMIPLADEARYLDLGFGVPSPLDDPDAFWP